MTPHFRLLVALAVLGFVGGSSLSALGQDCGRNSTNAKVFKVRDKNDHEIVVDFGNFVDYFEISKVEYEELREANDVGRVENHRRITFVAKAKHNIGTVPFGWTRFLDVDGIQTTNSKTWVSWKGGGLLSAEQGSSYRGYIEMFSYRADTMKVDVD